MRFYPYQAATAAIGTAYEITAFHDGIRLEVCAITLLLLFLIRYVNSYMLFRRRQKEFAVQSIMGMEQKTIGWLFFAETFLMGAISIAIGIALGVLCSQFMSAMLLASYGHSYELTWTLFPDTVLWTVGFFTISFFVVGLFNVRTIRKIKIIDMLSADRQNEPNLKKNRFIPAILVIYLVLSIWMLETGIQKMIFFSLIQVRFSAPHFVLGKYHFSGVHPAVVVRLAAQKESMDIANFAYRSLSLHSSKYCTCSSRTGF